ncbi:SMP-30/gluconolactonase/LRE family protein [Paenibacillus cremeus]|uniref:SMP-30/gluconolactonase/LRE family protein n=2 Tax=Paenibacillus cremeus TaxID=2163881 RepID=A0A559JRF3_9BACL|nr:SMP-30/gluconolactonase/LRE family protein [Paenibacillus cremeus]
MKLLIPEGAELEKIASGFRFIEGPVWDDANKFLYFTDIPQNIVYRWSRPEGVSVFRTPSRHANGLTLDGQRRLLACEHGSRTVTRTEQDGTITELALQYDGKRLNSPNDIVVKSDGTLYFTDPPYGLKSVYGNQPEDKELSFQGVYRLDPETAELRLLIDDFDKPNGLAFSPDEQILYVDDSARDHVRAFDVTPTGGLINGRVFAELDPEAGKGVPDGMKVDAAGRLYVAGRGGIWIFSSSGQKIGIIKIPEITANLAWAEDYSHLYITASTSLYRIRLNTRGIPVKHIN